MDFEARQDEGPLKAFFNTKAGQNYRSAQSGEKPIDAGDMLKRREAHWKLGSVPKGVRVLNLTIDVQRDRFECALMGTGRDRETWLADRFAIHVLDDGLTGLRPFLHKEHWRILLPLFARKVPLAAVDGAGKPIGYAPILSVTVDIGGSDRDADAANEGAKYFYEAAMALGIHATRITLVKGGSNRNDAKLMKLGQFADQKARGGPRRRSARLWIANVHRIKNIIDARLRRVADGPGCIHLPADLSEEHILEITAEQLEKGRWKNVRARNETLDLLVYAEAAILKPPFAQSAGHMRWVPRGFGVVWPKVDDLKLVAACEVAAAPVGAASPAQPAKIGTRAAARPTKGRSSSWMGRLK